MLYGKKYLQFMVVYFNIIYTMYQLRYRHIFLKIIETDFVNSKTNSIKRGWMKNEPNIITRKMIKMESQNFIQ